MNVSRFARVACAGAVLLVASAVGLYGHDFWLVPDAFEIEPGELLEVRGQTSSAFPSSEAAVAIDRIAEAVVIDAGGRATITEVEQAGTSLMLRYRPRRIGQYVVATVIHPRTVRESADGFRNYLIVEGAPEVLQRLEREGTLPTDSITRRYAKYAKAVVQVGASGPRAYAHVVGHPLEMVPLADPGDRTAGDTLRVRLLLHGRPLAHARVHAGSVVRVPGTSLDALAGEERHAELWTDRNGIATVAIDRAGVWNVRALYLEPAAPGSGADWETHWATIVFEIATGDADVAVGVHAPLPAGNPLTSRSPGAGILP